MAEVVEIIVVDNECLFPPKYLVRHFLKFDLVPLGNQVKQTFNFLRRMIINSKAMLLKRNLSEELRA